MSEIKFDPLTSSVKAENIEHLRSGFIWRCELGFHKWTPWAKSVAQLVELGSCLVQERSCLLCNKFEAERLKAK